MNCKKFLLGAVTCAMVVSFEKVQATEVEQQKQKLLREFMLRQDVHLMISNQWRESGAKAETWWKAGKYEDSIFKEISQAIVDCILLQGSFRQKDCIVNWGGAEGVKYQIFKFVGAEPTKLVYSPENWNALFLYNVIFQWLRNPEALSSEQIFTKVQNDLNAYYKMQGIETDTAMAQAAGDIKKYISDIKFDEYLDKLRKICNPINDSIGNPYELARAPLNTMNKDNRICLSYKSIRGLMTNASSPLSLVVNFKNDPKASDVTISDVNIFIPKGKNNVLEVYKPAPIKYLLEGIFKNSFRDCIKNNRKIEFVNGVDLTKFPGEFPNKYELDFVMRPSNISGSVGHHTVEALLSYVKEYNSSLDKSKEIKSKATANRTTTTKVANGIDKIKQTTTNYSIRNDANDRNTIRFDQAPDPKNQNDVKIWLINNECWNALLCLYDGKPEQLLGAYSSYYKDKKNLEDWIKMCMHVKKALDNVKPKKKLSHPNFIKNILEEKFNEEQARFYINNIDFIEQVVDRKLFKSENEVNQQLFKYMGDSDALAKWKNSCNILIGALDKYHMGFYIPENSGLLLNVIQKWLNSDNSNDIKNKAERYVQELLIKYLDGVSLNGKNINAKEIKNSAVLEELAQRILNEVDNMFANVQRDYFDEGPRPDYVADNKVKEKIVEDKLPKDIQSIKDWMLDLIYNEVEGGYGISGFIDEEVMKDKIAELKFNIDKINQYIENTLLNGEQT